MNKKQLYVGLMSGTSMDSIDAVLVDLDSHKPTLVSAFTLDIPSEVRQIILDLTIPGLNEIDKLGQLDIRLGKLFAQATNTLLTRSDIERNEIIAIGSHGQTIRHRPDLPFPFTLQIGDPSTIAYATGITTVADFRKKDMAAGGQGAPLVPAFHNAVFRSTSESRVILNIGGIANITALNKDGSVTGFDTGPGNILMDAWIQKHKNIAWDDNGKWAATGSVNSKLLEAMLSHDYFHKPPPKSSGREIFNLLWLEQLLDKHKDNCSNEDIQATLLQFTAQSIIGQIESHIQNPDRILVCGGGALNGLLMSTLSKLATCLVESTEIHGIHPKWVEAMAFAWLAQQTINKSTGNISSVTGAEKNTLLGGVYYA